MTLILGRSQPEELVDEPAVLEAVRDTLIRQGCEAVDRAGSVLRV